MINSILKVTQVLVSVVFVSRYKEDFWNSEFGDFRFSCLIQDLIFFSIITEDELNKFHLYTL